MREPKPVKPKDLPEGTVSFGGPIEWFKIRLVINGDDLISDDISSIMGCQPDATWEKSKPILKEDGSVKRIPRFGHWSLALSPEDTDEWDCGPAVMELLSKLPSDINIWRSITNRHRVHVSVALNLTSWNKGFNLEPDIMRYLGERDIEAEFDVYGPDNEDGEYGGAPRFPKLNR